MLNLKKLLLLLLTISSLSATQNIKLMTEIFPPFQYKYQDKLIGINTDIVQAIQKEMKLNNKIEVYHWSDALHIVTNQKDTAIFSMLRTPERENKYKWVGPLSSMEMVFFKKTGSDIRLETIEDARKMESIGVTQGVANHEMLSFQGFTNLDIMKNGNDEENIIKLVNGTIDLWPTLLKAGYYNARLQGFSGEIEPIENVTAFKGDLYIAFNINTDDKIVQEWQDAFDRLVENKTIENITKRYKDENESTLIDYYFLLEIFAAIALIVAIVVYRNIELSKINKNLHRLQNGLEEQAHRDSLTNLYNRRYFNNLAENILHLENREKQEMGVIMIDIDDFKLVNDTYGHSAGDIVIKDLASLLQQHTRISDIVARIGGEEFAILLPNTSLDLSVKLVSKIREYVQDNKVPIDEKNTLTYTISIGVDKVLENEISIDFSLNRADKALYKAKKSGKNKVCTN